MLMYMCSSALQCEPHKVAPTGIQNKSELNNLRRKNQNKHNLIFGPLVAFFQFLVCANATRITKKKLIIGKVYAQK